VTALAFAADSQRAVSGGEDGFAHVWQAGTGNSLRKLSGHSGPVLAAAWCNDGQRFVTGGVDKQVCLWEAESGKRIDWTPPVAAKVYSLAVDGRDRFVVAGEADGTAQVLPLPPIAP
jgi:WD40 repeat protein